MSFIDTAKRAFIGNDYEDDYEEYDEYEDEYEEEKPRRGFFSFLARDKEDDYEEYDEPQPKAVPERRPVSYRSPQQNQHSSAGTAYISHRAASPAPKVLSGVEVTLITPASFDDSIKIVREVKEGRIVIFDVSDIQDNSEARRIVDYICGAAEGIDCPFSRICPSIFCIAPKGVVMSGKKQRY